MSEDDLKAAHKHAMKHRAELERSTICGCFHCQTTFPPSSIEIWLDEGDGTALCPGCAIDSVLGDASGFPVADPRFLARMHEYWFERTVSLEEVERRSGMLETIDHAQVAIPKGGEGKARAFYEALLGLPEQPKPPELAKRGGCWFESAAVKLHCGVEEPFAPAKKAHIAFRVDDVAGLAKRARAAGYEVVDDDLLEGHERIYIYDPFGNRLEFLRPLP